MRPPEVTYGVVASFIAEVHGCFYDTLAVVWIYIYIYIYNNGPLCNGLCKKAQRFQLPSLHSF